MNIMLYGFTNLYPYTDFHELNLDTVLKILNDVTISVKEVRKILDDYVDTADKFLELYNAIINGDFPQPVQDAFNKWMRENAIDLVGDLVHLVFFGLTDGGYFVAFIPESWDDITFGTTGLDDFPAGIPYGHLTLSY